MRGFLIVLLSLVFCFRVSVARAQESRLCLTVTDSLSVPLFGVYVVNERNRVLVASTNDEGQCWISPEDFVPGDTIEFSCLGFEIKRIPMKQLSDGQIIELQEKIVLLAEVYVGIQSPYDILKEISKGIKKRRINAKSYLYYGNGQYEKITECWGRAIEYRREYGCFATIGNAQRPPSLFLGGHWGFIPRYVARSYPFAVDGSDTLKMLYRRDPVLYDSGNRKLFWLMRATELFGPLFGKMKDYDFQLIENESNDYVFQFKTKKLRYPEKTTIYCLGTLTIDPESHQLKTISYDYVDYYRCLRPDRIKRCLKEMPVVSQATFVFECDDDGDYFVKSCVLTSAWKKIPTEGIRFASIPSRKDPGKNRLIEKEAFWCKSYKQVPEELRVGRLFSAMTIGFYNPQGEYMPEVFSRLPELLDSKQAFRDLSNYMNIHKQFKQLSNRAYYPDDYLLTSPWITDKNMMRNGEDKFLKYFTTMRRQMLKIFFEK